MRKEEFRNRTNHLINNASWKMKQLVKKAESSGAIDIENAEQNYILPKIVVYAILKEMVFQHKPLFDDHIKEAENLGLFL